LSFQKKLKDLYQAKESGTTTQSEEQTTKTFEFFENSKVPAEPEESRIQKPGLIFH